MEGTRMTKKAFTLAEVLITLGIIGVVAALTIPGLVASYQKKVTETKIKKFYSLIQQAVKMKEVEDGALTEFTGTLAAGAQVYFDDNFKPYLQTMNVTQVAPYGVLAGFPDGSAMFIFKSTGMGILYGTDYNKLKAAIGANNSTQMYQTVPDGKSIFYFDLQANPGTVAGKTRAELIASYCNATDRRACAAILQMDGWEFKDDYPIKF
jgi:prepilin-type N-terminal cleavage/methylation domain-containing protein